MGVDQRRAERKLLQADVRGKDALAPGELLFEGTDLSTGGAFLKTDLLLEPGDGLLLEVRIPEVPEPIRAHAKVVWVRRFPRGDEQAGMGIQFLSMSDADREALGAFLARL